MEAETVVMAVKVAADGDVDGQGGDGTDIGSGLMAMVVEDDEDGGGEDDKRNKDGGLARLTPSWGGPTACRVSKVMRSCCIVGFRIPETLLPISQTHQVSHKDST
uniref:Uncharacterized protein n=1 Tax=Micrurus spixii TaxID=129469 RepID=A0A2D4NI88_9SAUR